MLKTKSTSTVMVRIRRRGLAPSSRIRRPTGRRGGAPVVREPWRRGGAWPAEEVAVDRRLDDALPEDALPEDALSEDACGPDTLADEVRGRWAPGRWPRVCVTSTSCLRVVG